jgi:hypothetical protein
LLAVLVGSVFVGALFIRVMIDCDMPTDFGREGVGWRRKEAAQGIDKLADAIGTQESRLDRIEDEAREARLLVASLLEPTLTVDSPAPPASGVGRLLGRWLGVQSDHD